MANNIVVTGAQGTVTGTAGDDIFIPQGGAHTFIGSGGYDFVDYHLAFTAVGANLAAGMTNPTWNGFTGTDYYQNISGLIGSGFDDYLVGNSFGFSTLIGLSGNDHIQGYGDGNTVGYVGKHADYTITPDGSDGFIIVDNVPGRDGTDTVNGVQRFQFTDGVWSASNLISGPPDSGSGTTTPPNPATDESPLVDDAFYNARNPDVLAAHINPDEHYAQYGWHEGRDPNAFFSTWGYLGANQDVRAANINPLLHYDQYGWKEGRDPSANFDKTLYLLHNPDVKAAGIDPLYHYLRYGMSEGRQTYTAVGTGDKINAQHGFDAEYYLLANPDVAQAAPKGADAYTFALEHYNQYGWHEGRNPNAFFDTKGYLNTYQDVKAANINPLQHYDQYGWKEGRDPSVNFDTKQYLDTYTDVAAAHVDPLVHYLQYGIYEGRDSFADLQFG